LILLNNIPVIAGKSVISINGWVLSAAMQGGFFI